MKLLSADAEADECKVATEISHIDFGSMVQVDYLGVSTFQDCTPGHRIMLGKARGFTSAHVCMQHAAPSAAAFKPSGVGGFGRMLQPQYIFGAEQLRTLLYAHVTASR